MLRRLTEVYGVPRAVLVGVSLVGMALFCVTMGLSTYAWLMFRWPGMPFGWAVVVALVAPPVFLLGVGVVGAIHDKMAGCCNTANRVRPSDRNRADRGDESDLARVRAGTER